MSATVTVKTVAAQPIAAVRRRILIRDIGATWKPALDQVWAVLGRHEGLRAPHHHNVFLYHHPGCAGEAQDIDFGVQVARAFAPESEVFAAVTPAGEAASALHVGPYHELGRAHEAVVAWAKQNGRAFAGQSWEMYGDWCEDPAKLETEVAYLLR